MSQREFGNVRGNPGNVTVVFVGSLGAPSSTLSCSSLTPFVRAVITQKRVVDIDCERSWWLKSNLKWSRTTHKDLGSSFLVTAVVTVRAGALYLSSEEQ
jgi:hypothetical protein